ncbi:MAG: prepilin-type N-terminal cleavage/methylation domain-containing protein [Thioalkalivibrio sp.]|nr:prepilin-type N-terminal cleavage/methylation domain-containing protein [Thioalkalivibrio sp.]
MRLETRLPRGNGMGQRGFTLVEVAVVLLIIGVIVSAVTIGQDLYRNAQYQRVSTTFVQGWQVAYDSYVDATGLVPGDSETDPSGQINGNGDLLCGDDSNALQNVFLAAGVSLPEGRAEGQEDRFAYQDSNGNPQSVRVCFRTVDWSEPGAAVGEYETRPRNVMVLENLTPSLARYLDNAIDGKPDARFGRMRESTSADATTSEGANWSIDDRRDIDGGTARDEDQTAVVTGLYLMNR